MTYGHLEVPSSTDDTPVAHLSLVPDPHGVLSDKVATLAFQLVDRSGVNEQLMAWKAEARKGPGGRPATFGYRALLVAMVSCALTDQPLHLTQVCNMMTRQFSPELRATLGIPDPPDDHDILGRDAQYRNVRTRWADMIDLVDPTDTPKNRRLDDETFVALTERRRAERSDEERQVRDERLEWLVNQILQASIEFLPQATIDAWNGSVGVDATLVTSHARGPRYKGRAKKSDKSVILTHSADPDSAWYVREGDHRDDSNDGHGLTPKKKVASGFEATLVISGSRDPTAEPLFPNLAMGMAVLHKPGSEPGRHGVRALAQVRRRGHRAGWLAADRAYSNAKAEDFQLAVLALGYRPIYDYQINQLGIMTSYQGFLQVDGAWYCPSMPKPLIDATIDFRKNDIDEATHHARLAERRNYLARPKGKPDEEGHVRLSCPAANPWPLVRCDLKPGSLTPQTTGRMRLQLKSDLKTNPPPSCSQQSVTIPPEAGAKFGQELLHGSAEWHTAYASLRNTNEGFNGYVKDPAHEALDDPARRRLHGVAPQTVLTALLLAAANIRKIRTFLQKAAIDSVVVTPLRPRRRHSSPLQDWSPPTGYGSRPSTSDPPTSA